MCIQQERLEQPLQHLKSVLMSDNAHNKRSTAGADPEVEEGGGANIKWGWYGPAACVARGIFLRERITHSVLGGSGGMLP